MPTTKKHADQYKDSLPTTNGIASYSVLNKDDDTISVTTMDKSLIDKLKNDFSTSETGPFGVRIPNSNAKDYREVLASQQGDLHERGFDTQKSIKFSATKIFAAIFVIGCVVGIAVAAFFKYIN